MFKTNLPHHPEVHAALRIGYNSWGLLVHNEGGVHPWVVCRYSEGATEWQFGRYHSTYSGALADYFQRVEDWNMLGDEDFAPTPEGSENDK